MKNILSAEQMRAADAFTIKHGPVSSIDLMERAAEAFVQRFTEMVSVCTTVQIVCGVGNNGGDGLAIARLLMQRGYKVDISLIEYASPLSPDCQINFNRFDSETITVVKNANDFTVNGEVVVDAIFGSGLNRPVTGLAGAVIEKINQSSATVVSVDIPSGLFADEIRLSGAVIVADSTISFQRPKLTFFIPESGKFTGDFYVVDIGLDEAFVNAQSSDYSMIEASDVAGLLPERKKFQHKGDFGRVQVFAGSLGKMGAALLCSKAVLRAGAGLLTTHVPICGHEVMQVSLPEAMVTLDAGVNYIESGGILPNTEVVCIGPGIGLKEATVGWLGNILENTVLPMVIDADGLNIIAQDQELMNLIPCGAVLTPHVGEFHRLFGHCETGLERLEKMRNMALARKWVILLKGAHSAIALPNGRIVFNTSGNAGMATAGSGDVLSGIITGLMAQGINAGDATIAGVYLHGKAGDLAAQKVGETALMASDLLNALPEATNNAKSTSFI